MPAGDITRAPLPHSVIYSAILESFKADSPPGNMRAWAVAHGPPLGIRDRTVACVPVFFSIPRKLGIQNQVGREVEEP